MDPFSFNPFMMGGFPQMMFDPRMMQRLMSDPQAFMQPPQQWMPQDGFTPSPGFNGGVPQPPNQENLNRLSQMQSQHRQEQSAYVGRLEDSIEYKKDLVFDRFHYDFKDGKPVLGEDGKPKLVEGGENADQRALRRGWERNEKMALQLRHEEEKKTFYQQAQDEARGFVGFDTDPSRSQRMGDSYKRLEAQERQMKQRHAQALSKVGTEGLPDLEKGGQLSQNVDQDWQGYRDMQAQHRQTEDNSPESRAMLDYQRQMQEYQQNMLRSMGWNPGQQQGQQEESFDPDAMRRLAQQGGGTWV